MKLTNLRKERHGGFIVGDGASNGDEFAFLYVFLESDSLFDCCEFAWIVATAAAAAGHCGYFEFTDGEEWSVDAVVMVVAGYRCCCHMHLSTFFSFSQIIILINVFMVYALFYFYI